MHGFFRIAVVSPDVVLANPHENVRMSVKHCVALAQREVSVVAFPELSLTGYSCGDLFQNQTLLENAWKALHQLATETRHLPMAIIVGLPVVHFDRLYNCAAVVQGGVIKGLVPKSVIPNYREFYERRWFQSGRDVVMGSFHEEKIPFGNNLLFRMQRDFVFGVEICEDLWSPEPISVGLAANGAHVIFNLSASNAIIGKADYRRQLVLAQSSRLSCVYAYVSAGPAESTTDLVFSGHCMIAEYGQMLAEVESRRLEGELIESDIDIDRIKGLRVSEGSYAEKNPQEFRIIELAGAVHLSSLDRSIDPDPFVPTEPELLGHRCREVVELQSVALRRRMRHVDGRCLVLGLSGGLDSTLAALVAKKAIDGTGSKIVAVSMPGYGTSERTRKNAEKLADLLDLEFQEIDIKPACEQHFRDIGHDGKTADITFENVQARERTQVLFDIANKRQGLVIGTGDLSEIALGWSTYGGDHLSMYSVNCSVPKTMVRHVIEWHLSKSSTQLASVLRDILETPVSPELTPTAQGTEAIIGPYRVHDFYLYHFLRYGCHPKRMLFLAKQAFDEDEALLKKCLKLFLQRFFANQFKRSCIPDGPKIGTISLSPRGDWRMPSDASAKLWLDELEGAD